MIDQNCSLASKYQDQDHGESSIPSPEVLVAKSLPAFFESIKQASAKYVDISNVIVKIYR